MAYTDPAFLLQNGVEYAAAHVFGLLEFLVEGAFVPHWKQVRALQVLGVLLLVPIRGRSASGWVAGTASRG